MTTGEQILIVIFSFFSVFTSLYSFYQTKYKRNAYGITPQFYILGAFVYADGIIFGIFFGLVSLVSLVLNNFILFLLFYSVFWLVRSVGETIYWFLEQFAVTHRNEIKTLPLQSVFHNDSIWFIFQICNQCITVVTIITSVYLFHLLLK